MISLATKDLAPKTCKMQGALALFFPQSSSRRHVQCPLHLISIYYLLILLGQHHILLLLSITQETLSWPSSIVAGLKLDSQTLARGITEGCAVLLMQPYKKLAMSFAVRGMLELPCDCQRKRSVIANG